MYANTTSEAPMDICRRVRAEMNLESEVCAQVFHQVNDSQTVSRERQRQRPRQPKTMQDLKLHFQNTIGYTTIKTNELGAEREDKFLLFDSW